MILKTVVKKWCVCAGLLSVALMWGGCRALQIFRGDPEDYGDKAQSATEGDPKIKPGLALRIQVTASGEAAVPDSVRDVDVNGAIQMPHVGPIKCEGLTVVELQEKIKDAYKQFYIDPQVSVSFAYHEGSGLKSPWGEVLVMGQVARPGPVNMPSTMELNVTRALMMAGNLTPLAKKDEVIVTRRLQDGKLKKFTVDIEQVGREGRTDLDIKLKPGDVVYVPETWY